MLDQLVRGLSAALFVKAKETIDRYQRKKQEAARAQTGKANAFSNTQSASRMSEQLRKW